MTEHSDLSGPQFRADRAIDQATVRTTIVGGRPLGPIPRGLEVLIKKAAVDAEFRSRLLATRAAAAAEIGLVLAPVEALTLAAAKAEQLEAIIARTTVPQEHRRAFLGQVAAAMLAALGIAPSGVQAQSVYQGPLGIGGGIAGPFPSRFIPPPPNPMPADNTGRVIAVIAGQLNVDSKSVTPEKALVKDLHVKPMQMVRLRKALAAEFRIHIPATAFAHVYSVGGAITYIDKALAKLAPPVGPPPLAPQGIMTQGGCGGGMGGNFGP